MKTRLLLMFIVIIVANSIISCRTHKDCRGRKKTVKTAMGGWL